MRAAGRTIALLLVAGVKGIEACIGLVLSTEDGDGILDALVIIG